jgi:hypothetical protein
MIGINMEFLIETEKKRPMNVFTVYRYTPKKLEQLERRAEKLLRCGVTEGNISHDKLVASGCPELAREVYFANSDTSILYKEKMLRNVFQCVTELCDKKGYTTKSEVVEMKFDDRVYDDITMPHGKYTAVRVTIGTASGHNWWCVMYPPLCIPASGGELNIDDYDMYFTEGEIDIMKNCKD